MEKKTHSVNINLFSFLQIPENDFRENPHMAVAVSSEFSGSHSELWQY